MLVICIMTVECGIHVLEYAYEYHCVGDMYIQLLIGGVRTIELSDVKENALFAGGYDEESTAVRVRHIRCIHYSGHNCTSDEYILLVFGRFNFL